MRIIAALIVTFLMLGNAQAQIIKLELISKKLERKYKTAVVRIGGKSYVWGELKSGFDFKKFKWIDKSIELFVLDQKKLDRLPYKVGSNGKKKATNKKNVVRVMQEHIPKGRGISRYLKDHTFPGIVNEFQLRYGLTKSVRNDLKKVKKASREWFRAQRRLINELDRLQNWLRGVGLAKSADLIAKETKREQKTLKVDAIRDRAMLAQKSVRPIQIPDDLEAAAASITNGQVKFVGYESQHIRLFFPKGRIEAASAKKLLELGETVIEGIRREFADPYAGNEDAEGTLADETPDGVFAEFCWVPDGDDNYEKFWIEFYGRDWGSEPDRSKRLTMGGTRARALRATQYIHYSRLKDATDHEGNIVHGLGHDLMNIHFAEGARADHQAWLSEGMAYYCSFEYLGRNTVTCKEFKQEEYARSIGKEGEKTVQLGQRETFNRVALSKGAPINSLITKSLFQLDNADLAKSWSLFDFLARKGGMKAVLWLRAANRHSRRNTDGLINKLRPDSNEIWGIKKGEKDFYTWLDNQWKVFARAGQKKDGSTRRRK